YYTHGAVCRQYDTSNSDITASEDGAYDGSSVSNETTVCPLYSFKDGGDGGATKLVTGAVVDILALQNTTITCHLWNRAQGGGDVATSISKSCTTGAGGGYLHCGVDFGPSLTNSWTYTSYLAVTCGLPHTVSGSPGAYIVGIHTTLSY